MSILATPLSQIQSAIQSGRLSHSYIVVGDGTRFYADKIIKWVLCLQEHSACGSCLPCSKLASENHPDVLFISPDGASVKIHQIESMQSFVYVKPFESDKKIVAIERGDLMTEQAQNRLLKTLEDPPMGTLILIMVQDISMLLDTILSRCQVIDMTSLKEEDIQNDEIMEKAIYFLDALTYGDAGRIFEFAAYAKEDKERFHLFLKKVISLLRDILILGESSKEELISESNKAYTHTIVRLSQNLKGKKIIQLIEHIDDLEYKLKRNMNFDLTVDRLLLSCIGN